MGIGSCQGKSASVETLTIHFVAPSQDANPGMVPMENVLVIVCSPGRTDCTTESEFLGGDHYGDIYDGVYDCGF